MAPAPAAPTRFRLRFLLGGLDSRQKSIAPSARTTSQLIAVEFIQTYSRHSSGKQILAFLRKMPSYEKKEPPGTPGGSCSCTRVAAYRLAWRLTPPPGPLPGPVPRTSPVETSFTHSEPLPL